MKKRKKPKTDGLSKLTENLDRVFSRYIRISHANERGFVACVTCNRLSHWKDLHCGHFISRRHKSTRWDERNVGPQCPACNIYNQGAGPAFASYLMKKYGPSIVDELLQESNKVCRMSRFEYEELITHYQNLLETYENSTNKGRESKDPVCKEPDKKNGRVRNVRRNLPDSK